MSFRLKLILFTIIPLAIALAAISLLANQQVNKLSLSEVETLRQSLVDVRKSELRTQLTMALNIIEGITNDATLSQSEKKAKVAATLAKLSYGPDGYFFIYDYQGNSIMHPRQPYRVGKNWLTFQDKNDKYVIQELITQAKAGGGYTNYLWEKPSANKASEKIAYSQGLQNWEWMIGTGLYIDDIQANVAKLESNINKNITDAFLLVTLIAFASLALVFGTTLRFILKERRLAAAKLKGLNKRVMEVQEEERKRVAQELHDGISQILISVKYNLELAQLHVKKKTADADGIIEKSAKGLRTAISEVRRISRDLRPGMLDDLGLMPALKSLSQEFSSRTQIKVELDLMSVGDALVDGAKTALFRVAQEALTNIERHSHADKVTITLKVNRNFVALNIKDNGIGIQTKNITENHDYPQAKSNDISNYGIGLRNMVERMTYYDGKLTVQSSESGTRILAILPIKSIKTEMQTENN